MLLGHIAPDSVFRMLPALLQFTKQQPDYRQEGVRPHQESRILGTLGQVQELLCGLTCGLQVTSMEVEST